MADSTLTARSAFRSDEARRRYLAHYGTIEKDWPLESQTRTVYTDHGTTFLRISGPAEAPPLVLLPGANTSSLCWRNVITRLSCAHRTYALDAIYDAGRSVPSRRLKDVDDLTAWLDDVLDALGLSRIDLMGLSYGGYAAAEYALHAPGRLRSVVLLSPAMTVAPISRGFLVHLLPAVVPTRAAFVGFTRWVMPYLAASDQAAFRTLAEELYLARRCYGPLSLPGGRMLTDAELAGIEVPVLYAVGDGDGVCEDAAKAVERVNAVAPRIRTVLIPDAAHDAVAVRPDAVADAVLSFLDA
jgi:pimeloyl-ACP methyl ester carboxylesterase